MQVINKDQYTGIRFNDGNDTLEIDCIYYIKEVCFSTVFGETGTVVMNKEEFGELISELKNIYNKMED